MAGEYDNLRTALEWARDADEDEVLLRLTAGVGIHWRMKGLLHREARGWLALALERASSPPQARMDVLLMLSAVALWQERDYAQADLLAAEWLSIAERTGDESGVLRALNTMALTALERRDFDEARTRFVAIRETAEKIGDRGTVAVATVNLSSVGLKSGEFQAALDDATEAVGLFRELGDDGGVAVALGNCGWSAIRLSDPVSAEGFFREGVVVAGRLGGTGFIADYAPGLAAALVARHEYERAAELLGAATSLREELERGFDDEEHEQLNERVVADAKAALGDEAFAAAWARGETTTPEEIVEFCAS